jgi:hypothetical protein
MLSRLENDILGNAILEVANNSAEDIQVWITLGATPGCVQNVADLGFVTNIIDNLQGWFKIPALAYVSYTSPAGVGINGNVSFGTAPQNCPNGDWPNGVNVAEFILNNSFQGADAQETIDISAVPGENAYILFSMSGGGAWNAGPNHPNVTEFKNKGLNENVGQVGVFPYGCDDCTQSVSPPHCPPPTTYPNRKCQSEAICNVQRDASTAGGAVTISFTGWVPYPC